MRREATWAGAVLATLIVGACASIEQLAPPVDEAMLAAMAPSEGVAAGRIEHGRTIYVTKCARCHSPERVTNYSLERWDEILPRMAHEASLPKEDEAAVQLYIKAVIRAQSGAGADSRAESPRVDG